MRIHNITIRNFKSLYGEHYFDFDKCQGLIKLSGNLGSGKTSLSESILWGLYGNIKKQNNTDLISWNCKFCEVEMNISSKNKEIYIKRNIFDPLIVKVNGTILPSSNKRDMQSILEEELFDVPKLAIIKMCIISFNGFSSLASMTPFDTKVFLDDIFGFKLFTQYNDQVSIEKKVEQNELIKLEAIRMENEKQIQNLEDKKAQQSKNISEDLNLNDMSIQRQALVEEGIKLKNEYDRGQKEYKERYDEYLKKLTEIKILGTQEKKYYTTFKSGICPTCGQPIDEAHIEEHHKKMLEYGEQYKEVEAQQQALIEANNPKVLEYTNKANDLKAQIYKIDSDVKVYKQKIQTINDNYDQLILEYKDKLMVVEDKIKKCNQEISDWTDMNNLFSKTLRYKLLETLIPNINVSIQKIITRLEQPYRIRFDQEFKCHIFVDTFDKEISYNNLSTGQKKIIDLSIIFGILQNIIIGVEFNCMFLDELFSNLDVNARNTMLSLLKETLSKDKTCFIINHAEMNDDYFDHKIRVGLVNKKIMTKNKREELEVIVKASKYEQVF